MGLEVQSSGPCNRWAYIEFLAISWPKSNWKAGGRTKDPENNAALVCVYNLSGNHNREALQPKYMQRTAASICVDELETQSGSGGFE